MKLQLANRSILQCLELAAANKEYIHVEIPRHRKLGKSKALIQFAKENDCTVFVHNGRVAEFLISQYGYKRIRSINAKLIDGIRNCVFDEQITEEDIDRLKMAGCFVQTGFMSVNNYPSTVR